MIYCNRDEIHFHKPFQMLSLLMDMEVLLTKWHTAQVLLVQRMIGSKIANGGFNHHLESTAKDKHRPFLDLFHLSNYLIPTKYVHDLQLILKKSAASSG